MTERHPRGRELSAYLDGTLSERRARTVGRHLESCPACSEEIAALRVVKAVVAAQQPLEPPPAWLALVEEQVGRGVRPSSAWRLRVRRRVRVAAAGAGVATLGLGIAIWLTPPAPPPVSFQDEVRQHLVQMDNPLGDQTSYVVEAR
ncbi:MAG: putative zinc-finger [Actinomycetota bacterium]|nr:putative zinc-finger [Actinomycetota bacterium]